MAEKGAYNKGVNSPTAVSGSSRTRAPRTPDRGLPQHRAPSVSPWVSRRPFMSLVMSEAVVHAGLGPRAFHVLLRAHAHVFPNEQAGRPCAHLPRRSAPACRQVPHSRLGSISDRNCI